MLVRPEDIPLWVLGDIVDYWILETREKRIRGGTRWLVSDIDYAIREKGSGQRFFVRFRREPGYLLRVPTGGRPKAGAPDKDVANASARGSRVTKIPI